MARDVFHFTMKGREKARAVICFLFLFLQFFLSFSFSVKLVFVLFVFCGLAWEGGICFETNHLFLLPAAFMY